MADIISDDKEETVGWFDEDELDLVRLSLPNEDSGSIQISSDKFSNFYIVRASYTAIAHRRMISIIFLDILFKY
jgi:hypothetical protein